MEASSHQVASGLAVILSSQLLRDGPGVSSWFVVAGAHTSDGTGRYGWFVHSAGYVIATSSGYRLVHVQLQELGELFGTESPYRTNLDSSGR